VLSSIEKVFGEMHGAKVERNMQRQEATPNRLSSAEEPKC
jgi:hypothetical protein